MLWGNRRAPRAELCYWVMPDGEITTLTSDIAIYHHIRLPVARLIVKDVLIHHATLAKCGRLIAVSFPLAVPPPTNRRYTQ